MPNQKQKIFLSLFAFILLVFPSIVSAGVVPCANSEHPEPCTLCHLIVGFWGIIDYGFKIFVFLAVTGLVIAGIMYIVSAGSEEMMKTAKTFLKQILIGFAVILGAWLLVYVVMTYFAVKTDLGIGIEAWNKFKCSTVSNAVKVLSSNNSSDKQDNINKSCESKQIKSLEIQCENGATDSLSLDSQGTDDLKEYKLTLMGKFECTKADGTIENTDEDMTTDSKVKWQAADETVAKVDKGTVTAIKSGETKINATYTPENSTGEISAFLTAYVDSCAVGESAENNGENQAAFKISEKDKTQSVFIEKAVAADTNCPVCHIKKEEEVCEFVAGSQKPKVAIILAMSNNPYSQYNACKTQENWDKNNKDDLNLFKNLTNTMAGDLGLIDPYGINFAVFRLNKVYPSYVEASEDIVGLCMKKYPLSINFETIYSKGFISKGSDSRAFSYNSGSQYLGAYYCTNDIFPGIMAHENIGHMIGNLDDEYEEAGQDPRSSSIHLNCTMDKECKKWKNIDGQSLGGCWDGCSYQKGIYRSSYNSIMRNPRGTIERLIGGSDFSDLQTYIINYRIFNFPSPPPKLIEKFN